MALASNNSIKLDAVEQGFGIDAVVPPAQAEVGIRQMAEFVRQGYDLGSRAARERRAAKV